MRRRLTMLASAMAAGFMASPASAYMVYVSNEKDNTVTVVDSTTMEVVKTINVGQRPRGITISHDGKLIYLCASDDDTIEIIDTATHEIVGSLPSGPDPELFVLSPDGKTLYVANEDDNLVTVIDLESEGRHRRDPGRRRAGRHGRQPGRQDHGQHVGNDEHGAFHRHLDPRDHRQCAGGCPPALRRIHARRHRKPGSAPRSAARSR